MASTETSESFHQRKLFTAVWFPTLLGVLVLVGFFGLFGAWAFTAPLSGAAFAVGQVSPVSNRKSIGHLEGGIVKEVHVSEGSAVSAGAKLVTLDDTQARAALEQRLVEARARRALIARLLTERKSLIQKVDISKIDYPPDLIVEAESDPRVAELIEGETEQFDARQDAFEKEIELYEQKIKQSMAELVEIENEMTAARNHILLIKEEIEIIEGLLKRGYETGTRLREMQRDEASQQAELAALRVKLVSAREEAVSNELKIIELKSTRLDEVTSELATARSELQSINEEITSRRDTLQRTVIRAPVDGVVIAIEVHTIGGVVAPGGHVMDLVPSNDEMIIDAKLDPNDIDTVVPGQEALVYLTAYPTRHMPPVSGRVESVSGDVLVETSANTDQENDANSAYYLTKVVVPAEELKKLRSDVHLVPGMPVEVLIVTQERTLFDYLVDPIVRSMRRSFRED